MQNYPILKSIDSSGFHKNKKQSWLHKIATHTHTYARSRGLVGSALKGVASGHRDKGLASNATGEPNQFMVDEQVKRTQK